MDRIEMDFNKTIAQANRLSELANEINELANQKMKVSLQKLDRGWESSGEKKFITKGNMVAEKLKEDARELNNIASSIRKVAQITYEAEQRTREIAEMRKAKSH